VLYMLAILNGAGALVMRRRIIWIVLAVPLTLVTVALGTAAAMPAARNLASALCNVPDYLRALAANGQVHF